MLRQFGKPSRNLHQRTEEQIGRLMIETRERDEAAEVGEMMDP